MERMEQRRLGDAADKSPWFTWGPQLHSWPVKIVRGIDEYGWHTIGIVTWLGSLFRRTRLCAPTCPDYDPELLSGAYLTGVLGGDA